MTEYEEVCEIIRGRNCKADAVDLEVLSNKVRNRDMKRKRTRNNLNKIRVFKRNVFREICIINSQWIWRNIKNGLNV